MAENWDKLSSEIISRLIDPIIEVVNHGINAANSIAAPAPSAPAPVPELRGGYETSQNTDQSLLSEKPEEEPPSVVVGEEERAEEEDTEAKPSSPLTPMVQKISDQAGMVADMGDADRFELAKRQFQNNQKSFDESIQGSAYQPLYEQGLLNQQQVQDMQRRLQGDNPAYWNLLGFTSQQMTPDDARAVYDTGFSALGNIEPTSKGADVESRQNFDPVRLQMELPGYDEQGNAINGGDRVASSSLNLDEIDGLKDIFQVDRNLIDDGRSEDSREAMFMTGEQYLRYKQQFGLPGRPDRLIDPDEIYSKQTEMERYGFVPYIVSDEGLGKFHDRASTTAVSDMFNDIANARHNLTDYTISYDGQEYSGKDFDRNSTVWKKTFDREMNDIQQDSNNRLVTDRSQASEFAVPHIEEWTVQIPGQGSQTRRESPVDYFWGPMDGQPGDFHIIWNDGVVWNFDDENDVNQSLGIGYSPAQSPEEEERAVAWYEMTPLELDDGRKIRADKANAMLAEFGKNKDEYADYGRGNFARPDINAPFDDNEGVDWAPWLTDILTGSASLFYNPTAAAQALAGGMNAYQGMKPGTDDYLNRTYSMIAQNPTEDQRKTATFGNVVLPVTEKLWGPAGGSIFKPVADVAAKKIGHHMNPLVRYLMGIGGEAAEEVPGNIVEQMMSGTGIAGWYGNQIYRDAKGNLTSEEYNADGTRNNLAYDEQGTAIRDVNTPIDQRVANLFVDAPEAMLGGGAMGALLGIPSVPRYIREYAASKQGVQPGYSENITVPLNAAERIGYDRGWGDEPTSEEPVGTERQVGRSQNDAAMRQVARDALKSGIGLLPRQLATLSQEDFDRADYENYMRNNDERNTKGPYYNHVPYDIEDPVDVETGRLLDDEFDDYLDRKSDEYIYKKLLDEFADRFDHRPKDELERLEEEGGLDRELWDKWMEDEWWGDRYGGTDSGYWMKAADRLENLFANADFENVNDLRDIAEEYASSGDVYDWLVDEIEHPNKSSVDVKTLEKIRELADSYKTWKPHHDAMKKIVDDAIKKNYL